MLVWLGRLIRVQTMNTIRGADRVRQARVSVSPVGPMNWAGGAYRTAELIDRDRVGDRSRPTLREPLLDVVRYQWRLRYRDRAVKAAWISEFCKRIWHVSEGDVLKVLAVIA
jgi:hypothetical protein